MPGKIESSSQMGVFLLRFDVHSSIGLEVSVYSISGTILGVPIGVWDSRGSVL